MGLFTEPERRVLGAISKLAFCNPFLAERTEHERAALGRHFVSGGPVWSASVVNPNAPSPNLVRIHQKLESLIPTVHARLSAGADAGEEELAIYSDCAQYLLFQRYRGEFVKAKENWQFYRHFEADWNLYFTAGTQPLAALDPAHVFACFRQLLRAFHHIFDNIIGNSLPAARLRAAAWQSAFTHDLRRYHRILFSRMQDFPTLITGPSGTGKELVARAIAGSRYVAFNRQRARFEDPEADTFLPINLAALSPALIESELFGHRRGSFTGAVGDRKGWLETCPAAGSVFLDELGEMELSIQVKLLRVLETRRFSMVGDTAVRTFAGKLIAATNRDLEAAMRTGRFREDLYYRLCADLIQTPSLREQIVDSPAVLDDLVLFMVRRSAGEEAESCFPEVKAWIANRLPPNYAWPGNYRELEQCVRNVIIRRSYQPVAPQAAPEDAYLKDAYLERFKNGQLKMDELTAYYAALLYRKSGSYELAARQLGMDRRTVKAKVEAFLAREAG